MKDKFYYLSFDSLERLHLTTFGKIKLSIFPEGVVLATYNYFKSNPKFPPYEDFFDSCIHQCRIQKIDLKDRFAAFENLCKKHNLNKSSPTQHNITEPDVDIETEFWKTECFKLTPNGIACIYQNRDVLNNYRNQMIDLSNKRYSDLFKLYLDYPLGYEENKKYLNELHKTFKGEV